MGETEGAFKIIADKKTRRILGAHLVGTGATELVSTVAAYMSKNGTLEDIDKTIFAHPSLSESIMEAAHAAEKMHPHASP